MQSVLISVVQFSEFSGGVCPQILPSRFDKTRSNFGLDQRLPSLKSFPESPKMRKRLHTRSAEAATDQNLRKYLLLGTSPVCKKDSKF